MMEFTEFNKIPRLARECTITEKIDGTNASIYIGEDGAFLTGSRTKWITPEEDNYGFAKWALSNKEELLKLGVGHHFGEWWGNGIQRGYGNPIKTFSLFNTKKWSNNPDLPNCCSVVPVIYQGLFDTGAIQSCIDDLKMNGSKAFPSYPKPEGVVIWHNAAQIYFKKTIEKDTEYKGNPNPPAGEI